MSIPGLGQIPVQAVPSAARNHKLLPLWEYRFEASAMPVTVRLVSGTAERDGTELARGRTYTFANTKSKLLTWHGCELEVTGPCDEYVAEQGEDTSAVAHLNLHMLLASHRAAAAARAQMGPRVLVCGAANSGRTSLVRSLAAWATRMGAQCAVVNADPREGMLTLPGTLSAAVFATIMDVESEAGWGAAPRSGPSAVPVKLPLVHYFGRDKTEADGELYKALVGRLAGGVTDRMSQDPAVRSAGLLIDAPAAGRDGVELLAHIVEEFSVNIIIVLSSAKLNQDLTRRFAQERTSLGEPIDVVMLEKSDGVVERDKDALQPAREAAVREYFFGTAKSTLSPHTQQIDFDALTVYAMPEFGEGLEKAEITDSMAHWTMAVMDASVQDPPEVVRLASVVSFVYVAAADVERRRLRILSPVSEHLGGRPLVLGRWPEPFINLLG